MKGDDVVDHQKMLGRSESLFQNTKRYDSESGEEDK